MQSNTAPSAIVAPFAASHVERRREVLSYLRSNLAVLVAHAEAARTELRPLLAARATRSPDTPFADRVDAGHAITTAREKVSEYRPRRHALTLTLAFLRGTPYAAAASLAARGLPGAVPPYPKTGRRGGARQYAPANPDAIAATLAPALGIERTVPVPPAYRALVAAVEAWTKGDARYTRPNLRGPVVPAAPSAP